MNDLCQMTARQAVGLLKKGEVSPLEMIDAAAERIDQTNDRLNSMPTLCLDRAREQARKLMAESTDDRPDHHLHGLPVAIKDTTDLEGVRTTYGSPIFADHIPEQSDYQVQILEGNGAISLGKTNVPEFAAGANTFNEVFGRTVNPWDTTRSCGGSSGGSAVALASGQAWLATGSDLGGSLRTPASFCSVVGLRPSPGRVARGPGSTPFWPLPVSGVMGRCVGDAALMLDAQVGWMADDPLSLHPPKTPFIKAVDEPVKPLKVAFSPDLGCVPVAKTVQNICAKSARRLSEAGIEVVEAHPDLNDAEDIFQIQRAINFVSWLGPFYETKRDMLKPDIIWNIEQGLKTTTAQAAWAERSWGALYHRTVEFFQEYDLLLCPTAVVPPPPIEQLWVDDVDGVKLDNYVTWLGITSAITLTTCPSISIPAGFTDNGLPVGVQVVGPPRGEAQALSGAAILEEILGLSKLTPIDPKP